MPPVAAKIGLLGQASMLTTDARGPAWPGDAGVHWLSVQQDRASPTFATVTGAFGASQIEMVTEHLEERRAVVNFKALLLPIDCYTHR
jgi:hypothetical protein